MPPDRNDSLRARKAEAMAARRPSLSKSGHGPTASTETAPREDYSNGDDFPSRASTSSHPPISGLQPRSRAGSFSAGNKNLPYRLRKRSHDSKDAPYPLHSVPPLPSKDLDPAAPVHDDSDKESTANLFDGEEIVTGGAVEALRAELRDKQRAFEEIRQTNETLKRELQRTLDQKRDLEDQERKASRNFASAEEQLRRTRSDVRDWGEHLQRRIKDLETLLKGEEARRLKAEEGLAEARDWLTTVDEGDLNQVKAKLGDLNDGIDEFAFDLFNRIPENLRETPISGHFIESLVKIRVPGEGVRNIVDEVVKASKDGSINLEPILLPLFRSLVAEVLYRDVFSKFHYACSDQQNSVLVPLYQTLFDSSTQQQASRWRMATFQTFDNSDLDGISSRAVGNLVGALDSLYRSTGVLSSPLNDSPLVGWHDSLLQIFLDAVKLQSTMQAKYLSCDLRIQFPVGEARFDPLSMASETAKDETKKSGGKKKLGEEKISGGKKVAKAEEEPRIIAAMSFGLSVLRRESNKAGRIETTMDVLTKSEVLASRWLEKRV